MSIRVSRVQNNSGNSIIARVQISPCVPRNDVDHIRLYKVPCLNPLPLLTFDSCGI